MKQRELDTQAAPCKWFAARDARMRNYAKASHYSEQERVAAERMRWGLELCYGNDGIFINYRDRFIAVKVNAARVKNKVELALLEESYVQKGITKAVSAQGVIYRIPKV